MHPGRTRTHYAYTLQYLATDKAPHIRIWTHSLYNKELKRTLQHKWARGTIKVQVLYRSGFSVFSTKQWLWHMYMSTFYVLQAAQAKLIMQQWSCTHLWSFLIHIRNVIFEVVVEVVFHAAVYECVLWAKVLEAGMLLLEDWNTNPDFSLT